MISVVANEFVYVEKMNAGVMDIWKWVVGYVEKNKNNVNKQGVSNTILV